MLAPYTVGGTILAGGTLSAEIDLGGMYAIGLITTSTPANGTLSFQVSQVAENGTLVSYKDLSSAGAVLSFTLPSAGLSLGGVELNPLLPFRFIKMKSSVTQTNGVAFTIVAKG
jgi:hypothetical protein